MFRDTRSRLRTKGLSDLRTAAERLSRKSFDSEEEAVSAARARMGRLKPAGITVRYGVEERSVRVRPHPGPDAFREEYRTVYCPKVEFDEDDGSVRMAALMAAGTVLVTNLGRSPSEDGDVRKGAAPEKVLELYNGQFACEHAYRLMKSGIGLDCIYLQNPLRVDGMLFVVAMVAMLFTLMDAVLRGRHLKVGATVYRMRVELQNSRLVHDGADWDFEGPPDKMDMFLERLSILGIDADSFLEPRRRGREAPGNILQRELRLGSWISIQGDVRPSCVVDEQRTGPTSVLPSPTAVLRFAEGLHAETPFQYVDGGVPIPVHLHPARQASERALG